MRPPLSITLLKSTISHLGGLEKYALRLLSAFEKKGCAVTLLTTGSTKSIETSAQVLSHSFSHNISFLKVSEFDKFCQNTLKEHPSAIVFGLDRNRQQTHIRAGNGVHMAYLERRKRHEGLIKGLSFALNPLHRLLLSIEKQSFENPDLKVLFTNSHMVRNEALSYYNVDPKKIQVVHNGVEWQEMQSAFDASFDNKQEITEILKLDPSKFQFLFIGHNFARKGLDQLLSSLTLLNKDDFHLSVIGTDKNIERYKQEVARMGLSSAVTLWGQRKDVLNFYQMADCLVIPSLYDPFANVTVEALAMGLYVVSSKHNGASEVLTEESGTIIDDLFNAESFASCLKKAQLRPKNKSLATSIRDSVSHLDFSSQLSFMVDKTLHTS